MFVSFRDEQSDLTTESFEIHFSSRVSFEDAVWRCHVSFEDFKGKPCVNQQQQNYTSSSKETLCERFWKRRATLEKVKEKIKISQVTSRIVSKNKIT